MKNNYSSGNSTDNGGIAMVKKNFRKADKAFAVGLLRWYLHNETNFKKLKIVYLVTHKPVPHFIAPMMIA